MAKQATTVVSTPELARRLGCTVRRIQQLTAEGLPRIARGKFDLVEALAWAARHYRKLLEERTKAGGPTLAASRVRHIDARTQEVELRNSARSGEYLKASWVEEFLLSLAAELAGRLDGIAGRLSSELCAITDPGEMRTRLLAEHRAVRDAVADAMLVMAEREGKSP